MDFDGRSIFKEVSWRQRENWLKEGDRNSFKFFHKMPNAHRKRNFLAKIKVNGKSYRR